MYWHKRRTAFWHQPWGSCLLILSGLKDILGLYSVNIQRNCSWQFTKRLPVDPMSSPTFPLWAISALYPLYMHLHQCVALKFILHLWSKSSQNCIWSSMCYSLNSQRSQCWAAQTTILFRCQVSKNTPKKHQ